MQVRRGLALAMAALAIAGTMATAASAQGLYLKEISRDGRIYVFNSAAAAVRFETTGQMDRALTRAGVGPNSETVVADSETALELYFFKHGIAQVVERPAPKPDHVSLRLGGTIFTDYTYQGAPRVPDADGNLVSKSEFEVRRAYLTLTGSLSDLVAFRITPDITARQVSTPGAPTSTDGSLVVRLKYAYGQINLDRWAKGAWFRAGQQQTPYLDFMEGIYRYRFQGTMFTERGGYMSSSDVGVSARVALPGDYGEIHAGYYNGDTYSKAETNDQKAFQVRGSLRPAPRHPLLKGLRVTAFYDADRPAQGGSRTRFVSAATFEHAFLTAAIEYLRAADRPSGRSAVPDRPAAGWSWWAVPRLTRNLEALVRHDRLRADTHVDGRSDRTLAGLAWWFTMPTAPLAAAVLVDYEQVQYTPRSRPTEQRVEVKWLFHF